MPRLGCDTRVEKTSIDIVDRVSDLRNRVSWLKNVEFCLLGDQNDRLTKITSDRHSMEMLNNDLRKELKLSSINLDNKNIDDLNEQRNKVLKEHNRLLYEQKCLVNHFQAQSNKMRNNKIDNEMIFQINQQNQIQKHVLSRIRQIQDRLTSVKLTNKTLNICKQYLQCDLDLLRKEIPNVRKDIGQKFHQTLILKKEFVDIFNENQQRLNAYQQLLDHTEAQNQQRRAIHEQAIASVAEQLEDQHQIQMSVVNDMTTSFESRKLTGTTGSISNSQQKNLAMSIEDIAQIRFLYDQFYNIIMTGYQIDITNCNQLKITTNEISAKINATITMINRMIDEKEQLQRQINRIDKIFKSIEISINIKNDIRQRMLDTMIEQCQSLEFFFMNDTIENENRILRQINDFIIVLSKSVCENIDKINLITEPSIDFIERLQYVCDLVLKATKIIRIDLRDEHDHQISPTIRQSGSEEYSQHSQQNSQILKESRSFDRSITPSLSSLSSRRRRNSIKMNIY